MSDRTEMNEDPAATLDVVWRTHRRRLLDVAYRMLGSVTDAEDIVGEAYARLVGTGLDEIDDVEGWLVSVTSRLCIDRLRSSEQRRRAYVGPWLPEPILTTPDATAIDPAERVTLDDSVRMALLVVLEQLSPAERTSFVLHDLFALTFEEIGDIVGRSPAACRQLASRARRRIQADPEAPRAAVDRGELEEVARRFADACAAGMIQPLLEVLDPNVVGDFDSGGNVPGAPLHPITGADRVARVLIRAFGPWDLSFSVADVNGDPGVIVGSDNRIVSVIAIGVRDGRIDVIHAVGNPEKLRHLAR